MVGCQARVGRDRDDVSGIRARHRLSELREALLGNVTRGDQVLCQGEARPVAGRRLAATTERASRAVVDAQRSGAALVGGTPARAFEAVHSDRHLYWIEIEEHSRPAVGYVGLNQRHHATASLRRGRKPDEAQPAGTARSADLGAPPALAAAPRAAPTAVRPRPWRAAHPRRLPP